MNTLHIAHLQYPILELFGKLHPHSLKAECLVTNRQIG